MSGIALLLRRETKFAALKVPRQSPLVLLVKEGKGNGTASRKEEGEVVESGLLVYAAVETEAEHLGKTQFVASSSHLVVLTHPARSNFVEDKRNVHCCP